MDLKTVVLDIQCFKDNVNNFIVKEVACLDIDTGTLLFHHIVKPPYERKLLLPEKVRECSWLTNNFHGLDWHDGDILYTDALDAIKRVLRNSLTVYVKCDQKMKFINSLISEYCDVVNLEVRGCPSLKLLNILYKSDTLRCNNHKYTDHTCSLSNVVNLRKWYTQHLQYELWSS